MNNSVLLKEILIKADEVKNEFESANLASGHIIIAIVDWCSTEYRGFTVSDTAYHPDYFEEERIRYLCLNEVKLKSLYRHILKMNKKAGKEEQAFSFDMCEQIAMERGREVITSDIVLLCALMDFQKYHNAVSATHLNPESIISVLRNLDKAIFDYVISSINNICAELMKKAERAASIRDWKPAAKFAEPEEVMQEIFSAIDIQEKDNVITIKLLGFFVTTDLKLSIHRVEILIMQMTMVAL